MQTILGAGGQIATELARELHDRFGVPLRLVSRHPRAVHPSDEVFAADLTDPAQIFLPIGGGKAQVRAEAMAHIIAIQQIGMDAALYVRPHCFSRIARTCSKSPGNMRLTSLTA